MRPVRGHVGSTLSGLEEGKRAAHVVALPLSIADFCSPSRTNSLRCIFSSMGLGSKVSMCEGPPSIIRKMTFFALVPEKWPSFGARGFAFSSAASSEVRATLPSEAPRP
jgi:hypothetical protein